MLFDFLVWVVFFIISVVIVFRCYTCFSYLPTDPSFWLFCKQFFKVSFTFISGYFSKLYIFLYCLLAFKENSKQINWASYHTFFCIPIVSMFGLNAYIHLIFQSCILHMLYHCFYNLGMIFYCLVIDFWLFMWTRCIIWFSSVAHFPFTQSWGPYVVFRMFFRLFPVMVSVGWYRCLVVSDRDFTFIFYRVLADTANELLNSPISCPRGNSITGLIDVESS